MHGKPWRYTLVKYHYDGRTDVRPTRKFGATTIKYLVELSTTYSKNGYALLTLKDTSSYLNAYTMTLLYLLKWQTTCNRFNPQARENQAWPFRTSDSCCNYINKMHKSAEHAIRTYKKHLIAILITFKFCFPLAEWDGYFCSHFQSSLWIFCVLLASTHLCQHMHPLW